MSATPIDPRHTWELRLVEAERDEVVQQRNYAMRQRDEERRAKEGNIRHLNAAIVRAETAEQQLADLRASITAVADEHEAVMDDRVPMTDRAERESGRKTVRRLRALLAPRHDALLVEFLDAALGDEGGPQ